VQEGRLTLFSGARNTVSPMGLKSPFRLRLNQSAIIFITCLVHDTSKVLIIGSIEVQY
jgi:hypothetical protein